MDKKKMLIHDLEEGQFASILPQLPDGLQVLQASPAVHYCVGCFGCWIQTPAECVIRDRCRATPEMLAASKEMILISRNLYGGFSPDMKAVLDRSIGYVMPYFRIVGGEMHHTMRYDNPFALTVHFYGAEVSKAQQDIARKLVAANAVNLGAGSHSVAFHKRFEEIKEVLA